MYDGDDHYRLYYYNGYVYAGYYENNSMKQQYSLNLTHVYKPSDSLVIKSEYDAKITELESMKIKYECSPIELQVEKSGTSAYYIRIPDDETENIIIANGVDLVAVRSSTDISGHYTYFTKMGTGFLLHNDSNDNYHLIITKDTSSVAKYSITGGRSYLDSSWTVTSANTFEDIEYTSTNVPSMKYIKSLDDKYVTKDGDSTINGNLTVTGTVTSNGSNTVTHYCPIEAGEEISDFKVGKPVFLSGHVYKRIETKHDESNGKPIYEWISTTVNDRQDCICSVIIDGTYKDFVGVIVSVDDVNGCITFASHGDVLFYVDDANLYQIGDVLLYDGKILDENYALTLKIQQSIIGKVMAKINEHTLAIFMN